MNDIDDSNAWAVGRFDALMSQAKLPEGVASQIPAVKLFSASGHINGGLSAVIRAETRDDQAAQNLRDVVQGFLALAKLQSNTQPELQALVNSLQLSGTGKTVALSFQVPSQVIDAIAAAKQHADEDWTRHSQLRTTSYELRVRNCADCERPAPVCGAGLFCVGSTPQQKSPKSSRIQEFRTRSSSLVVRNCIVPP